MSESVSCPSSGPPSQHSFLNKESSQVSFTPFWCLRIQAAVCCAVHSAQFHFCFRQLTIVEERAGQLHYSIIGAPFSQAYCFPFDRTVRSTSVARVLQWNLSQSRLHFDEWCYAFTPVQTQQQQGADTLTMAWYIVVYVSQATLTINMLQHDATLYAQYNTKCNSL